MKSFTELSALYWLFVVHSPEEEEQHRCHHGKAAHDEPPVVGERGKPEVFYDEGRSYCVDGVGHHIAQYHDHHHDGDVVNEVWGQEPTDYRRDTTDDDERYARHVPDGHIW